MIPSGSWFRLWCSIVSSPKHQCLPAEVFRQWVNYCALAKAKDGTLPAVEAIAYETRKSVAQVQRFIGEMKRAELLDELSKDGVLVEGYRIHDWNAWQHPVDRSTERVKRWREKQSRNAVGNAVGNAGGNGKSLHETEPEYRVQSTEYSPPTPPLEIGNGECNGKPLHDFEIAEWFEQLYAIWPVKGERGPAMQLITTQSSISDPAWREDVAQKARIWAEYYSDPFVPKKPTLAQWASDLGWKYSPPAAAPKAARKSALERIFEEA